MTLDGFGQMIAAIDPQARRYANTGRGAYTVWREYGRIGAWAGGENEGGWRVQVDRYTREENDAVAAAIAAALEESDEIAFEHTVDSELEDGGVLIRHIFDCEVW